MFSVCLWINKFHDTVTTPVFFGCILFLCFLHSFFFIQFFIIFKITLKFCKYTGEKKYEEEEQILRMPSLSLTKIHVQHWQTFRTTDEKIAISQKTVPIIPTSFREWYRITKKKNPPLKNSQGYWFLITRFLFTGNKRLFKEATFGRWMGSGSRGSLEGF